LLTNPPSPLEKYSSLGGVPMKLALKVFRSLIYVGGDIPAK
jgi:hypothetical protein